jgi:ABC-type Fe3+ transport system permease subunit/sugar lactone lactonase YvrE
MNGSLLANSLVISTLTTVLALVLGALVALATTLARPGWRMILLALVITTLALPSFLIAGAWLDLLQGGTPGPSPVPPALSGPGGASLLLAVMYWPLACLATLAAWQQISRPMLEAEPCLRGLALVRNVLVPLARPALAWSALVIFVLSLGQFSVPALLQTPVLPVQMWIRFNTDLSVRAALISALPLIAAPVVALLLLRSTQIRWPLKVPASETQLGDRFAAWLPPALLAAALVVLLASSGLPLAQVTLAGRTWTELPGALAAGHMAIWHSALFAGGAATVGLGLGLLLWRLRVGGLLWLLFFIPGVLLQAGLVSLLSGEAFSWMYPSATLVVAFLAVKYLAPAQALLRKAFQSTDRGLGELAELEGLGRWQRFRLVFWPQHGAHLAASWYIIYLLALWDVESLVLVVPPGGETLALRIFNLLHYGHNAQVNALCVALLALALAPLAAWWIARQVGWRVAPWCLLATLAACSRPPEEGLQSRFFERAEIIGTRGAGLGEFNKPRSVAVDLQDNLFVVDMTGRVQKFSPEGKFLHSWQMPETDKGRAKGMGRDRQGNILVNEPHYSRVNHYSPTGGVVRSWGGFGTNAGQLTFPRAVAANSRDEIVVSEYGLVERVQCFTPGGTNLLRTFGHAGTEPGEFNRPEGLALDAQDRIYVADSCNHRIQVFTWEGTFLRTYGAAGSAPGQLSYPYDITVDPQGRQYVCEFGNSRIQIFDAEGRSLEIIGAPGAQPGQFNNPWGVALDSHGNLYVADSQNHRVQKLIRRQEPTAGGSA